MPLACKTRLSQARLACHSRKLSCYFWNFPIFQYRQTAAGASGLGQCAGIVVPEEALRESAGWNLLWRAMIFGTLFSKVARVFISR